MQAGTESSQRTAESISEDLDKLIKDRLINPAEDTSRLQKSVSYTSPSRALKVAAGTSLNGPAIWKTKEGIIYKVWKLRYS